VLDTLSLHETAEGALLKLRPAGAPVRALAWSIDTLIRGVLLVLLGLLAGLVGDLGVGFYLIAIFLLDWFYNVLFEVLRGATPGKRRLGLRVVNDNGTPVTWSASLLRNLLRVVDFLPLGYGFGLLWMLFHPQAKRLGDLAAGTLVVYAEPVTKQQLPALDSLVPRPPPVLLDYRAQQAMVSFAERAAGLSDARCAELAELLRPLHGRQGEAAVQQLLAYARSIAGQA
jgi:uncharacterized RDD family membrane protein YckC